MNSDEPNLEESTRQEAIEDAEFVAKDGGINRLGTLDILMNYPYNMQEWLGAVESIIRENVDLARQPDETVVAEAQVDKVSYVDPDTNEFDVRFEGRWSYADGVTLKERAEQ